MRAILNPKSRAEWIEAYREVRAHTLRITEPLQIEDYGVQSTPDVSPPKWHLAHTTWFFEAFLLDRFVQKNLPYDSQFRFLFNSYYKSVGEHLHRPTRGLLSRPALPEIFQYRKKIDERVVGLLESISENTFPEVVSVLELGLNHEEQHQELLLTDIKHILCSNPIAPRYKNDFKEAKECLSENRNWKNFKEGLYSVGTSDSRFAYDNERPEHRVFLEEFEIAPRLVTNGEYLEFISAGAYTDPKHWLSLGWDTIQAESWNAPLYWEMSDGDWKVRTLSGLVPLNLNLPVSHVSYFEAEAFARWKRARLPTEFEWEVAARTQKAESENSIAQLFGDLWQWTASAYLPYPGFQPLEGPEGEYNGKFMCSQMALRGSSFATPPGHERHSYRNYFPPHARWQFMGIRLARGKNQEGER